MCKKCLKDLNIETLSNKNNPDEAAPSQENYWSFADVEFNPLNLEEE